MQWGKHWTFLGCRVIADLFIKITAAAENHGRASAEVWNGPPIWTAFKVYQVIAQVLLQAWWVFNSLCRWGTWAQRCMTGSELPSWCGGGRRTPACGPVFSGSFSSTSGRGKHTSTKVPQYFSNSFKESFQSGFNLIKKVWQENQLNSYPAGIYLV